MRIALKAVAVALGTAAAACGGDGGTAPEPASFAGTWAATTAEYVSVANPSLKQDMLAQHWSFTLVLVSGGTFTLTSTHEGDPPWVRAGTWNASIDIFTLTFTSGMSGEWQLDYVLSGNRLTLTGAHTEYDVNGDGQPEDARFNLAFARR